jgi:hypothetical protein
VQIFKDQNGCAAPGFGHHKLAQGGVRLALEHGRGQIAKNFSIRPRVLPYLWPKKDPIAGA